MWIVDTEARYNEKHYDGGRTLKTILVDRSCDGTDDRRGVHKVGEVGQLEMAEENPNRAQEPDCVQARKHNVGLARRGRVCRGGAAGCQRRDVVVSITVH